MTNEETVRRANEIIKDNIFPSVREMWVGKRFKAKSDDPVLKETLLFVQGRLKELADVEGLALDDIEIILFPDMVENGKAVLNICAVTTDDADMIRAELNRHIPGTKGRKDDGLPN